MDLVGIVTGVLVKNPHSDIRFMFLSKEGIRLPDPTAQIRKLVGEDNFNPQDVNEQLLKDGLIWPINHPTRGTWVRDDVVDVSQINSTLPPIDFSWVGHSP